MTDARRAECQKVLAMMQTRIKADIAEFGPFDEDIAVALQQFKDKIAAHPDWVGMSKEARVYFGIGVAFALEMEGRDKE